MAWSDGGYSGFSKTTKSSNVFVSGGLEDTAACEVSLVSVLLHEVSVFVSWPRQMSSQQHAMLHTVFLTHTARMWKTVHVSTGTLSKQEPNAFMESS